MVFASHYIFADVLSLLERERIERLEEVCTSYAMRYVNDDEFQELIGHILLALKNDDSDALKGLKPRIRESMVSRKIHTSGGTRLWFKDRRSPRDRF